MIARRVVFIGIQFMTAVLVITKLHAASPFPKTGRDLTFYQSQELLDTQYAPYAKSQQYQPLAVSAPQIPQAQPDSTTAPQPHQPSNNSDNTIPTTDNNSQNRATPQKSNSSTDPQPPVQPVPTKSEQDVTTPSPKPQPSQQQQQQLVATQSHGGQRGKCFTRDTHSAKRFVPPTALNGKVYWWIGDSRFTQMYIRGVIGKKHNEGVIAHAGRGHEWLTKTPSPTGISLLESCVADGDVVILGLGTNDTYGYNAYISTYKQLIQKYPHVQFKVLSVNPVCDAKAKLKNSKIETFNAHMKNAFPNIFVDTYSILKNKVTAENTDAEGLHYRGTEIDNIVYNTVMK